MTQSGLELSFLYVFPLWLTGTAFLLVFLLAIEFGFRSGLRVYRANKKAGIAARGDATINAMLALLGLLLAFTYAFGLSRYDQRKEAVIEEVNALGTAFHRSDLLSEPGRTELRRALLNYTRTRLLTRETVRNREDLIQAIEQTMVAQAELWPATMRAIRDETRGPVEVAVISAINTVLDVHTQRMAAGFDNIPSVVLLLLVFVSAFALAVTVHNAALQGNVSRWRIMAFALLLAALIIIIMDFDMPLKGLIRVSTIGLRSLIHDMEAAMTL